MENDKARGVQDYNGLLGQPNDETSRGQVGIRAKMSTIRRSHNQIQQPKDDDTRTDSTIRAESYSTQKLSVAVCVKMIKEEDCSAMTRAIEEQSANRRIYVELHLQTRVAIVSIIVNI